MILSSSRAEPPGPISAKELWVSVRNDLLCPPSRSMPEANMTLLQACVIHEALAKPVLICGHVMCGTVTLSALSVFCYFNIAQVTL